jgi:hypothetical protein
LREQPSVNKQPIRRNRPKNGTKLEDGNLKVAVWIICSEDTAAPDMLETFKALESKHPKAPTDHREVFKPDASARFTLLQVVIDDMAKVINSFLPGSSAGPDGLTPQHLKDLFTMDLNHSLITATTDLANLLLSGGLDDNMNDAIYGGRLIAQQ